MVARGKSNKKKGNQLEAEARTALVGAGYILCRWQNTVEFTTDYDAGGSIEVGKLVGARPKFNFFTKSLSYVGTGFPDFIVMKKIQSLSFDEKERYQAGAYQVIGLECKRSGYLDPEERGMVKWYLDNKIFPKIVIAKKDKTGHMIFIDSQTKEELLMEDIFK